MNWKRILKQWLPGLADRYRTLRDRRRYRAATDYLSQFGFTVTGDTSQHYGLRAEQLRQRNGELPVFEMMLERADCLVDVGANFGFFTMLAATRGKPVLAIEPHPETVRSLLANISRNGLAGIRVLPVAVAEQPGFATLYGQGEMAGLRSEWGGMQRVHGLQVPVHRLDDLIPQSWCDQRLLVKMDVEGFEAAAVAGAPQLLSGQPGVEWIIEHSPPTSVDQVSAFIEFIAVFESHQYHAYLIGPLGLMPCSSRELAVAGAEWVVTLGGDTWVFARQPLINQTQP
jgi:FkbM family methyltransferase